MSIRSFHGLRKVVDEMKLKVKLGLGIKVGKEGRIVRIEKMESRWELAEIERSHPQADVPLPRPLRPGSRSCEQTHVR